MPSRFIQQRIFIPRIAFLLSTLALAVFGNCPSSAQPAPPETRATPNTPEAHLGKGYDALKQDRYDVAVEEFRAALAMDPKLTLRARFPLAVALFELHKSDEARREFTAVRRETGDHANVFYYLGRLDLDERKFDGAI